MTITLVQIAALIIATISFILYMMSNDSVEQVEYLLWIAIMTVIIVGENIMMAIYGVDDEDDDDDQS